MDLQGRLARSFFFQGFAAEEIQALLRRAEEAVYPAGKEILSEGDPAETFHVLLQGAVSVKVNAGEHGELVLSTLREAGEIFGWSALVEGGRSTASAECLEETRVLSLRKRDLEELFAADPALGYRFMKRLASMISLRLESTRTLLAKEIS